MRLVERRNEGTSVEYTVQVLDLAPRFGSEVFDIYSRAGKILFGKIDADGTWRGRYVRYRPAAGPTSCRTGEQRR
jgi:hypothetical protein